MKRKKHRTQDSCGQGQEHKFVAYSSPFCLKNFFLGGLIKLYKHYQGEQKENKTLKPKPTKYLIRVNIQIIYKESQISQIISVYFITMHLVCLGNYFKLHQIHPPLKICLKEGWVNTGWWLGRSSGSYSPVTMVTAMTQKHIKIY